MPVEPDAGVISYLLSLMMVLQYSVPVEPGAGVIACLLSLMLLL